MIYTIHLKESHLALDIRSSEDVRFDNMVAIPESVAKWAIFFPPYWLAYHRLWWALILYLLATVLITIAAFVFQNPPLFFLSGLLGVYLFLEGHQLRRQRLDKLGYKLIDIVDCSTEQHAINRSIASWNDLSQQQSEFKQETGNFRSNSKSISGIGLFSHSED